MKLDFEFKRWFLPSVLLLGTLGMTGFFIHQCLFSPDVAFLTQNKKADWIMFPEYELFDWIRPEGGPLTTTFKKSFTLATQPKTATIRIRAFRSLILKVNGTEILHAATRVKNWKHIIALDISPYLKNGVNRLEATVMNYGSPPVLWLCLEALPQPIRTDPSWIVLKKDKPETAATVADDTSIPPFNFFFFFLRKRSTLLALQKTGWALITCFVCFIFAYLSRKRFAENFRSSLLPLFVLEIITLVWIIFIFNKFVGIPLITGFDAPAHLKHIGAFLNLEPFQNPHLTYTLDDFAFHHPPFFYWLSAWFFRVISLFQKQAANLNVIKLIPFVCGLTQIWLAWFSARHLFRQEIRLIMFTIVISAIIPMNIYLSAYISNETLHAVLISSGISLMVVNLTRSEAKASITILTAIVSGLALLTKLTAFIVIPIFIFFLAVKTLIAEKNTSKSIRHILSFVAVFFGIAGWYFLKNFREFGSLSPGLSEHRIYWQSPGFHTLKYFLSLGDFIIHPYYASTVSFFGGLYSTFWGDGFTGSVFPPLMWNYPYVSSSYVLALPLSILLIWGAIKMIIFGMKNSEIEKRMVYFFLFSILVSYFFFLTQVTLSWPHWSLPKAFYGLFAVVPISIAGALALDDVHKILNRLQWPWISACFYGWLGTLAFTIYLAYTMPGTLP